MKVLVTGSTGFIGTHVVEMLLKRGHVVITTSRVANPTSSWRGKTRHIPYDIETRLEKNLFVYFQKPDLVIHLAWRDLDNYYADSHIEIQLSAHIVFLNNLIKNGLKDLSVAGTCLEYGLIEGVLREDTTTNPETLYGVAKDTLRRWINCKQKKYSFHFRWLRYFYINGKERHRASLIPLLAKAIDTGDSVFNMSGGEQLRDYLSVERVAEYTISASLQKKIVGTINICSGTPISVRRLVEEYIASRNASIQLNMGYYPYVSYEPMAFWGDNSKLAALGGKHDER